MRKPLARNPRRFCRPFGQRWIAKCEGATGDSIASGFEARSVSDSRNCVCSSVRKGGWALPFASSFTPVSSTSIITWPVMGDIFAFITIEAYERTSAFVFSFFVNDSTFFVFLVRARQRPHKECGGCATGCGRYPSAKKKQNPVSFRQHRGRGGRRVLLRYGHGYHA